MATKIRVTVIICKLDIFEFKFAYSLFHKHSLSIGSEVLNIFSTVAEWFTIHETSLRQINDELF